MQCDEREKWLSILSSTTMESDKNWIAAFCLSFFLGYFGADRFYLSSIWLGFLKLFTFGGFGVLYILDILLLLFGKMKDGDGGIVARPF